MTDTRFDATVTTTCGYCGVGCRLEAHAHGGKIASISPALDGPANEGHTCLKGRFAHQFSRSRERLTAPLIREGDGFRLASWEEAIERIVSELTRIKGAHGPDAFAGARVLARDQRGLLRDGAAWSARRSARTTSTTARASATPRRRSRCASRSASPARPARSRDIDSADAAIIIGANPTEGHPVVGARIKQATMRGLRLVTIDPRRIELADYGVLHLAPRPGTNAAVMLGLSHIVRRDGLVDQAFIDARTEGYDALEELLDSYAPAAVAEITGVAPADLEEAAHIYAEAQNASSSGVWA